MGLSARQELCIGLRVRRMFSPSLSIHVFNFLHFLLLLFCFSSLQFLYPLPLHGCRQILGTWQNTSDFHSVTLEIWNCLLWVNVFPEQRLVPISPHASPYIIQSNHHKKALLSAQTMVTYLLFANSKNGGEGRKRCYKFSVHFIYSHFPSSQCICNSYISPAV